MQHITTKQTKQKISANLDHHWSKNCLFLCVQTNWVCPSGTQRFCKITLDWEPRHWLWLESSHSVKNVNRVTIFLNVTGVESQSPKIVTQVESSHWLESRYHSFTASTVIFTQYFCRARFIASLLVLFPLSKFAPYVLRPLCPGPGSICHTRLNYPGPKSIHQASCQADRLRLTSQ